jgi:hypothetical protein
MCLRCDGFTRDECCGRRHHTRWPASWQKDKGKRVATKQGHYVKWKELRCNCSCHLGLFCDLFVARLAALQRVVRRNKCINEAVGDKFCLRRRVDFFLRRKSFSDTFLCTCARALEKTLGWWWWWFRFKIWSNQASSRRRDESQLVAIFQLHPTLLYY